MQINSKQDMFYSLTLSADTQEYVELPVIPGMVGLQITTSIDMAGFADADGLDDQLSSGWASLFEEIRIEDNTRQYNRVLDLKYSATLGQDDMAFIEELVTLGSPIPGSQNFSLSARHLNLWTGPLGEIRIFLKTRSAIGTAFQDGTQTSVTLNFTALMGPQMPQQCYGLYHIGNVDVNEEFTFPTSKGNIVRSVMTCTDVGGVSVTRNINDIYSDGVHLSSNLEPMILDYNVLRDADNEADWTYDKYYWSGDVTGKKIRFEQQQAARIHFLTVAQTVGAN